MGAPFTILYTLFETAKLAGVDPQRYVLEATRHARHRHAPRRPHLIGFGSDFKSLTQTPQTGRGEDLRRATQTLEGTPPPRAACPPWSW